MCKGKGDQRLHDGMCRTALISMWPVQSRRAPCSGLYTELDLMLFCCWLEVPAFWTRGQYFHFTLGIKPSITCPEEEGLQRGSKSFSRGWTCSRRCTHLSCAHLIHTALSPLTAHTGSFSQCSAGSLSLHHFIVYLPLAGGLFSDKWSPHCPYN